jgi:hypothetical protein
MQCSAGPIQLNGPGRRLGRSAQTVTLTLSGIPTVDPESPTLTPSLLSVWRRRRRFLSALRPSLLVGRARPARRSCSPCSPLRPAVDWGSHARLLALLVASSVVLGLLASAPCSSVVLALLVSRARLLASAPCGRLGISCSAARPARRLVGRARSLGLLASAPCSSVVLALLVSRLWCSGFERSVSTLYSFIVVSLILSLSV